VRTGAIASWMQGRILWLVDFLWKVQWFAPPNVIASYVGRIRLNSLPLFDHLLYVIRIRSRYNFGHPTSAFEVNPRNNIFQILKPRHHILYQKYWSASNKTMSQHPPTQQQGPPQLHVAPQSNTSGYPQQQVNSSAFNNQIRWNWPKRTSDAISTCAGTTIKTRKSHKEPTL